MKVNGQISRWFPSSGASMLSAMNPLLRFLAAFVFAVNLSAAWKAGTGSAKITPEKPVPLVGYAARTNVFKEVDLDVYAKALALEDESGNRAVIVAADICTLSPTVAEPICQEISSKNGLKRDHVLLNLSHTHSGPSVSLTVSRPGAEDTVTKDVV